MMFKVKGKLEPNAILGGKTWFHAGGTADLLFRPADLEDLQQFLPQLPPEMPLTILGVGSNVIVRDGGVRGVVVRLGQAFAKIEALDDLGFSCGAAALDFNVALKAADAGVGGMAFLSGIPGSIGGAVFMNAGAYGGEVKDVLVNATILTRQGKIQTWGPEQLGFSYRHSNLNADTLVVAATLRGHTSTPDAEKALMEDIREKRHTTQPVRAKTGGSTFANPSADECAAANLPQPMRAWQLIDAVGGRTLKIGGAHMAPQHCNFMLNDGTATATDLENLGDELIKRVYERFGIQLRWEIKRIGERVSCPKANS